MGILSSLISMVSGSTARANDLNANFSLIANAIPGVTTSVNGPTTGTATATVIINNGGILITVITFANYRNGPAGDQVLTLPIAYAHQVFGLNGSSGVFHCNLSGSNITTIQIMTAFASGSADGGVSSVNNVRQNNLFHIDGGCDALGLFGSDSATHNGNIILIGS